MSSGKVVFPNMMFSKYSLFGVPSSGTSDALVHTFGKHPYDSIQGRFELHSQHSNQMKLMAAVMY